MCRLLLNAALLRLEQRGHGRLKNFEFALEGPPYDARSESDFQSIQLDLDDDAYGRKFAVAQKYSELAADLARTLSLHDQQMFRIEHLRPVQYGLEIDHLFEHPPFYERYGEKQVAAGLYREVIRFRQHLAPLAKRLGQS